MAIHDVKYYSLELSHEDERRTIDVIFNGISFRQGKCLTLKQDSILGGHFHNYDELFWLLKGEGTIYLEDTITKENEQSFLTVDKILLIPRRIAHKGFFKKGSILMGFTEEPYISPEHNDYKYDF